MDYNNLTWNEIYNLIKENKMELLGYANGWCLFFLVMERENITLSQDLSHY